MSRQTRRRPSTRYPRLTATDPRYQRGERDDRHPHPGGAQLEPRLGPYEFRYEISTGYVRDSENR